MEIIIVSTFWLIRINWVNRGKVQTTTKTKKTQKTPRGKVLRMVPTWYGPYNLVLRVFTGGTMKSSATSGGIAPQNAALQLTFSERWWHDSPYCKFSHLTISRLWWRLRFFDEIVSISQRRKLCLWKVKYLTQVHKEAQPWLQASSARHQILLS